MTDIPDFGQMARQFQERAFPLNVITVPKPEWSTRKEMIEALTDLLRQVWNARGAADVALVEAGLLTLIDVDDPAREHIRVLKRELRTLDR